MNCCGAGAPNFANPPKSVGHAGNEKKIRPLLKTETERSLFLASRHHDDDMGSVERPGQAKQRE